MMNTHFCKLTLRWFLPLYENHWWSFTTVSTEPWCLETQTGNSWLKARGSPFCSSTGSRGHVGRGGPIPRGPFSRSGWRWCCWPHFEKHLALRMSRDDEQSLWFCRLCHWLNHVVFTHLITTHEDREREWGLTSMSASRYARCFFHGEIKLKREMTVVVFWTIKSTVEAWNMLICHSALSYALHNLVSS